MDNPNTTIGDLQKIRVSSYAFVFVLSILFALFIFLPWIGRNDCINCSPSETAKAISAVRTIVLQFLIAVGGATTIYFTWKNYLLSDRVSINNIDFAQQNRASENFIKAVEQLGSPYLVTRIGGIYGLGRILRTASPKNIETKLVPLDDYWHIMDILSAFIRQSLPTTRSPRATEPPEDVKAALDVLARHGAKTIPSRDHVSPVALNSTDLSYAWMASKGHFEWGYFIHSYLVDKS